MPAHYGNLPFREQIRFFLGKRPVPTARWDDIWQSAHDTAFMVAGAAKADLLNDLQKAVQKGIEGGTIQQFRKDFDEIVARHGWTGWTGSTSKKGRAWRTRVIYETNLRTSYAAGRWEQIQANKDRLPYLEYKHSDSVRHPRPLHLSWDGLVLPVDHPWWQTHYPPNGWGCKCRVVARSAAWLRRHGKGPSSPPDDGIDPKTGAPAGIDKGWAYAPGASRPQQLAAELKPKAQKLPPKIKRELLADLDAMLAKRKGLSVSTPAATGAALAAKALSHKRLIDQLAADYQAWVKDIQAGNLLRAGGRRQVGALSENVVSKLNDLGVQPKTALLTIEQRQITHLAAEARKGGKALTLDMIMDLPRLMAKPRAVIWDGQGKKPALLYVFDVPGDDRLARIAVRVNLRHKGQAYNDIRSGSLVPVPNLEQPGLILLEGKL